MALARRVADAWEPLRARHCAILRSAIRAHNGLVFQIIGDAFCAVFATVGDALLAAVEAQGSLARSLRTVRKVVFMGMREPAHNLDNVLDAIGLPGTGGGTGHKNLVFSTVGDAQVFERLRLDRVKRALDLSPHSTKAALRAGKHAMMNMIPCKAVDGLGFRRPSRERAAAIGRSLTRRCILTRLRCSAGQDVTAGCGHLRARALASGARAIAIVPAA